MNIDQAVQVIDQAVALASLNRQGHIAVQQAMETIVNFIRANSKPVPPVENKDFDEPTV